MAATFLEETARIEKAAEIERSLPPGKYEIRLYLIKELSQERLDELQQIISSNADLLAPIEETVEIPSVVSIKFRKHAPSPAIAQWSAIIPLLPAFLIAVLIGIGIFRIEEIVRALIPLVLLTGGLFVAVALVQKMPAPEGKRK
jgi:hypothetical protein